METTYKFALMKHSLEVKVDRDCDVTVFTGADIPFLNKKPIIRKIADLTEGEKR